jgi:putative FmdB family regulatory protein
MSLIERIRDTIGGEEETLQYRYRCRECGSEFETAQTSRTEVECPECGASGPRSISKL